MYVVALFVRMLVDLQRNGSDSKTYQPSAYVRGTVVTFKAEAADITAKGANHGVLAHKSVPVALAGPSLKQKLLQLHALSKARTSKLAMMDGEDAAALSTRGLASGGVACAVSLGAK